MRVIQLLNVDGDHAGLYLTNRQDNKVEKDIEETFEEYRYRDVDDIQTEVDEKLADLDIKRVFAEEVYTSVI